MFLSCVADIDAHFLQNPEPFHISLPCYSTPPPSHTISLSLSFFFRRKAEWLPHSPPLVVVSVHVAVAGIRTVDAHPMDIVLAALLFWASPGMNAHTHTYMNGCVLCCDVMCVCVCKRFVFRRYSFLFFSISFSIKSMIIILQHTHRIASYRIS